MNSPEIASKIRSRHGAARRLADATKPDREVLEELYLSSLSRLPSERERALLLGVFDPSGKDRRAAVEDVLWGLMNTKEFLYNH